MGIYKNIQEECRKQNRSIMGLEADLGFARGSICKWDSNKPAVTRVKAVADVLGVTIETLLEGDSSGRTDPV